MHVHTHTHSHTKTHHDTHMSTGPEQDVWAPPFGRRRLGAAVWAPAFGRRRLGARPFGRRTFGRRPALMRGEIGFYRHYHYFINPVKT